MAKESPYSIPKHSWWCNTKSKRIFVITEKWYSGVGDSYALETIELLEMGKCAAVQITPVAFKEMVASEQLELIPIKKDDSYRLSFI